MEMRYINAIYYYYYVYLVLVACNQTVIIIIIIIIIIYSIYIAHFQVNDLLNALYKLLLLPQQTTI